MKIMVTGGAGFIGANLIEELLIEGHEVTSLDNYDSGLRENEIDGATYYRGDIEDASVLGGDFDVCFKKDKFDANALQLLIVSKFFNGMEKKWDAFTQINNGKVTCITDNQKEFDKLIKTGKLKMDGNYFRSFQDMVVGLYVKLS
jgi:hypothetical protein